ncbi:creatininase family protein [Janibacter melonis]|uniref:creatininase family protein n=1 Tax=Janibacter melonis TaxID=262209 RepID=UPI001E50AA5D|nr:creatininase family protein [Janibacter melonis]MCB5991499.1 creatininase family protein [Janibacter melonis]
MTRLAEMTSAEAAQAAQRGAVLVLPVGAVEQHGPALPLGTDTIRAEAVVDRLVDALDELVVVGPTVPVGVSPHHLAFPGTMTLRPATFAAVLTDYVDSLARHGWRRVLVVTGHGGNNATLGVVAQDVLRDHPEVELAWAPVTPLAPDALGAMDRAEVTGHCGEAETAQMLHLAPDLVRSDRLAAGTTVPGQLDPFARLSRGAAHPAVALPYDRLSASGVLGDPTSATAEDGRAVVDEVVRRLADFVREWSTT